MPTRLFGPEASRMPLLGLGCSRIGSFNNPQSGRDVRRLLEHALDLDIGLFDTADIYGQGDSERAIGRLLRGRRDRAFVITKVGRTFSRTMRMMRSLKPVIALSPLARSMVAARRGGAVATDFSPRAIAGAIDASLRRLGFDRVDALLLHSPSAEELRDDGLVAVLASARRAGKVAHYGVACDDAAALEAAVGLEGVTLVEVTPDVLAGAGPGTGDILRSRGIGVVLREVIRCRGDLTPRDAVIAATRNPLATAVVVGSSSHEHLSEIARAVAGESERRTAGALA